MKALRFLGGRLATGGVVLWLAATMTFLMMHLTSGDTAIAILGGPEAMPTPEQIDRVRAEYGLDKPLWVQYGDWLWRLLHGDLGQSYRLRVPVAEAIAEQLWPTVRLVVAAGVLSIGLALAIGLLTAKRSHWLVRSFSGIELIVMSVPTFVTGIVLLLLFAFYMPILPVVGSSGWGGVVLPAVTLALPLSAMLSQVLRQDLEEILERPFILTARSRGLSDWGTRTTHALRHALLPLVTLSGFTFAGLLSGAAIVESLFSRPGVGRLMLDATAATDVPIVIGVTLLSALFYVISSTIVDLIAVAINPGSLSA